MLGLLFAACGSGAEPAPESGSAPVDEASRVPESAGSSGEAPSRPQASRTESQDEGPGLLFESRSRAEPAWKLDEVSRRDPGVDGWPTEVQHDRAKTALKHFFHGWLHPEPGSDELAHALAPDFEGLASLRPEPLEQVFDDGDLRAFRPTALDPDAGLRGADELARTLAEALAPFHGSPGESTGDVDASFKIVKVDGVGPRFEATVLVELAGRLSGPGAEPIQQNATWRVAFSADPGPEGGTSGEAGGVLVRSIRVLAFDEVHAARPLLAEHTRHVFGGNDFWEREFRLGVDDYYFRQDKLTGNAFIGGQGIAVGDLTGDGLDDIYVCQQGGLSNRLLVHKKDGTTRDIAAKAGVDLLDNTRSALIADFDGDGLQDLAVAVRQDVLVFYNEGEARSFKGKQLRGLGTEDIFTLTAADADLDGDLDIYGCRYVTGGIIGGVPTPYHDADNGASNLFFRNLGEREWSEDTDAIGLGDNNRKFSLASIWDDFDRDGDPDLYVSNDFGRNNLYVNVDGHYRDEAVERGADDMAAGMGASVADIDLDGWPDLLVTNMFSSAGLRIASIAGQFMGGANQEVHDHYVRHARGNTLLRNRGDGYFEDVTEQAGVAMGRWGWGALFVDLNNDGLEDMYCPNGFITNQDPDDM